MNHFGQILDQEGAQLPKQLSMPEQAGPMQQSFQRQKIEPMDKNSGPDSSFSQKILLVSTQLKIRRVWTTALRTCGDRSSGTAEVFC